MVRIVVWFALCGISQAKEAKPLSLMVEGKKIGFLQTGDPSITLSANCFKDEKPLPCRAIQCYRLSKKLSVAELNLSGGRNPGSVKCKKLGGKVILAQDAAGDERSVCKFKDNSLVDCGALY